MTGARTIGVLVAILATGGAALADEAVSFKSDLLPVLKQRCAICHLTGSEAGNMALHPRAAHDTLVDVTSAQVADMQRVAPGDPAGSYLLHKLEGTHLEVGGTGTRMPFNEPPLGTGTIGLFRAWIKAGAPDN